MRIKIYSTISRRNSETRLLNASKASKLSRLRIQTLESEQIFETDVFVHEDVDERFTKVLSWREMTMRNDGSPTRMSLYPNTEKDVKNNYVFRRISEDLGKNKSNLSTNRKPIEKIVEKTDDDNVAELLISIEALKLFSWTMRAERPSFIYEDILGMNKEEHKEVREQEKELSGLRFEVASNLNGKCDSHSIDPLLELDNLKSIYMQIKTTEIPK